MDPRLLEYYNRELQFIREMGGEFAQAYPKIAGRLSMDGFECADPYVERLLEGFAFLAARVQLKLDAEYPTFTQHLLEMVYPHYLAPTPSMAVVQLQPMLNDGALADGVCIPRGSEMRNPLVKGMNTPCQYRTAHDVTLWPLQIIKARYYTNTTDIVALDKKRLWDAKAAISIRLKVTAGLSLDKLGLDKLCFYLRGNGELPMVIYEQIFADSVAVVAQTGKGSKASYEVIDKSELRPVGFEDDEAMLPFGPRSFQGYRLLHEYFSFPQRFLFFELQGLEPFINRGGEGEIDIHFLFKKIEPRLENNIDEQQFALFCTPVINLFPKRADRIHIDQRQAEYHVVADRTRPMDFEIYEINKVTGIGVNAKEEQEFLPFYSTDYHTQGAEDKCSYYSLTRKPRRLSSSRQRSGPRSSYIGTETFINLVDGRETPFSSDLRQIAVEGLCTNRDLPLGVSIGKGQTDFHLQASAPVESIHVLSGPTPPRPSLAKGKINWHLISHLSLNYLSITDSGEDGASALREILALYGDTADRHVSKQIEGVRSVSSTSIIRRLPLSGPVFFGRGLEIKLTFDERAFEGTGVFLLGAVLSRFFAKYVSVNSFTETLVCTTERGDIMRWPAKIGQQHIL